MADRWEYKTEHNENHGSPNGWSYCLERLGREGWELMGVSIVPFVWRDIDGTTRQHNRETFYFKRKVEEEAGR